MSEVSCVHTSPEVEVFLSFSSHLTIMNAESLSQASVENTSEKDVSKRIVERCRNCGRKIDSILEEYCGLADCEEVAAMHRPTTEDTDND